jgi:hypothetical protein
LLFAIMYIAVNLACIGYYLREGRSEFNALKHLVVPILGVIAMIPAVLAVIGGVTIPILNSSCRRTRTRSATRPPSSGSGWCSASALTFVWRSAESREALAKGRRRSRRATGRQTAGGSGLDLSRSSEAAGRTRSPLRRSSGPP